MCICRWGGASAEVKALFETHELVLRGGLKRKVALADLTAVHVDGDELCFMVGRELVTLSLGAKDAASWAKKIATPAPSLADKLGLKGKAKAFVIGAVKDAALSTALKSRATKTAAIAAATVAIVESEKDLARALKAAPAAIPIWIVHGKGKAASFGETPVRAFMRAKGFIDTKVSAVSDAFSATRFTRR